MRLYCGKLWSRAGAAESNAQHASGQHAAVEPLRLQRLEQPLGVPQIGCIEAFAEPGV